MMRTLLLASIVLLAIPSVFSQTIDMNSPPIGTTKFIGSIENGAGGFKVKNVGNFAGPGGEAELVISDPLNDRIYIILGRQRLRYPSTINLSNLLTNGVVIQGNTGSGFGFSVSALDDFDRDGFKDIAVGAPFEGEGGRVYIIKGISTLRSIELADEENLALTIDGSPGELLGFALSDGAFFNDDTFSDLLIYNSGPRFSTNREAAYLIYGNNSFDQKTIRTDSLNFENSLTIHGPEIGVSLLTDFGKSFNYIGDIDNDGFTDAALFAGVEQTQYPIASFHIIPGGSKTTGVYAHDHIPFATYTLAFSLFDAANEHVVDTLTSGDINNDGQEEIIMGFPSASLPDRPLSSGAIAVVPSPFEATPSLFISRDNPGDSILIGHSQSNSGLGSALSASGNRLAAGAFNAISPFNATQTGAIYIIEGDHLSPGAIYSSVESIAQVKIYGIQNGDQFGNSFIYNQNPGQNNLDDLFVGIPGNNDPQSPSAFLIPFEPETGDPYDLNGDNKITQEDLYLFAQLWRSNQQNADLNNDGLINSVDLLLLLNRLKQINIE